MPRKALPRSPYLNSRFAAAMEEFGIAFKKSSRTKHKGNRGRAREASLAQFFQERLPKVFAVVEGEVVDLNGAVSPQLDLMFYNQTDNFPFEVQGSHILPAEALLASVEVKSKLDNGELKKSVAAAKRLRSLQPYGRALSGTNVGSTPNNATVARYYHCIFAYDSNLAKKNWMKKEYARILKHAGTQHLIDAVYVLNKGLLNIPARNGQAEDGKGAAITNFYFSILNFIRRENDRRKDTPYKRYVTHPTRAWTKLTPS
jgi:hypothetical protein